MMSVEDSRHKKSTFKNIVLSKLYLKADIIISASTIIRKLFKNKHKLNF